MAPFSLDTINGPAFGKDDYDAATMMQLEEKISRFYLYFHALEQAQIRKDGKWVSAAVYISGAHRYIRYRLLKFGEKADVQPQTFYQFPETEYTTVDFKSRPFSPETDTAGHILKAGDLEILCPKDRDYNIAVFSMQVSDYFYQSRKALYAPRTVSGLEPYAPDDHARRMGLPIDENRLIFFPVERFSFIVTDEFQDVLELGIFAKTTWRIQKRALNGKLVPANLAMLRTNSGDCQVTAEGTVSDYKYQGYDRLPMDHPLYFYLDKNAKLYGNASQKTLVYQFEAFGRRGIELHFTTEAEYYTVANLLYYMILAMGGKPASGNSNSGSGSSQGNGSSSSQGGSLADAAANARTVEPETDPMEDLNSLVGMTQLKNDVQELIALMKMQKMREEKGMKSVPVTLHLVFTGNPGTGKTTVARILGRLYKQIGVLSKGQLIETDRSGLVAGYIGHTAIQTQKKIDEAMGGILFIDEAYTLAKEGNDFGQEAIDTLLKAMEDHRKDFVVIVAGYPDLMQKFINSNPGLKSRFNKYMYFPDYTAEELIRIFESNCKKYDYKMSEDAAAEIKTRIEKLVAEKDENFANAREIRNLFETIITNQASRVGSMENVSDEELVTISVEDVQKD